jgi:site-specific DNA-methyltransferase (adenine-specific)/modification methylase
VQVQGIDVSHLETEQEANAFGIALNRTTRQGQDDPAKIAALLQDIKAVDETAFVASGFDGDDLDDLLREIGQLGEPPDDPGAQINKADELQKKWQTERGQLWAIPSATGEGQHRILCGDSTNADDVARLMGGVKADLLLTDPPYGINMDKGFEGFGGFGPPIARRQYPDSWDDSRPSSRTFDYILPLAEQSIIFGGNFFADLLPMSTHWIVWDKNNTMPTYGDCELAWTNINRASVKKYEFTYNGLIGKEKERFHPTQKPIGLFSVLLDDYTKPNMIVIDVYLGSGTTLVACEQTGRTGYGMEIAPEYVAVSLERLTGMGLEPRLHND